MDIPCHIRVNIRQHVGRSSHQCHVQAAFNQIFRYLQSDKAASDDNGRLRLFHQNIVLDPNRIRDGAEGEDPLIVLRDKGRNIRRCARCDHQAVIGLHGLLSAVQVPDRHGFCGGIDFYRLCSGTHVDRESCVERRRRLQLQILPVFYRSAYIIGQPAVGIGDKVPPLQNDDFRALIQSPQPCRRGRAACNAADNHYLHAVPCLFLFYSSGGTSPFFFA